MKKYKIFVNGNLVAIEELTPAEVLKLNNDTSISLISRN